MSNLRQVIKQARGWGFDEFRCGMAVGTDFAFAEIVRSLGYSLHAYMPFKGFGSTWPQSQQDKLREYLEYADVVKYVSEPPFYKWKMIVRDKVMVEDTSLVIAVWDGREEGGTYQTVEYAKKLELPIWNINPKGTVGWL